MDVPTLGSFPGPAYQERHVACVLYLLPTRHDATDAAIEAVCDRQLPRAPRDPGIDGVPVLLQDRRCRVRCRPCVGEGRRGGDLRFMGEPPNELLIRQADVLQQAVAAPGIV